MFCMPGLQSLCVKNVLVVCMFIFMYEVENNTVYTLILRTPYSVDCANNNFKFSKIEFGLIPPILPVRPFLVTLVSYL